MKEAYALRRTVPPSAEIEARIEQMLSVGVGENPRESLSELARLGARLIIQRAVEDEFDAWLGRARYERRAADQRGELKERFERFRRRDLYGIRLVGLFRDTTFISVRPSGPKEGMLVAWGFTEDGERILLSVMLGALEAARP
jgi:transposase-like protein